MIRETHRPRTFGLSAAIALFAAVVILGVGGWQIRRTRDAILRDAEQNIQSLSRSLAQHAGRTIEAVDLALVGVVEQVQTAKDAESLPASVVRRRTMLAQARNLAVVDANGRWSADAAPDHGDVSSADREYFQWHRSHADQGLHIGDMLVDRTTGLDGLPVSRRVNAPDGSFAGLAVAILAPEYFTQFYKIIKTGPKGAIALWRDDGRLLLRYPPVPDAAKIDQAVVQSTVSKVFKDPSGISRVYSTFDGVERVYAYEHVDGLPLVVTAAVAVADVLAEWHRDAVIEAAVVCGAALALISLSLGLSIHRKRIQSLHDASRQADRQYRLLAENSHDLIAFKPSSAGARSYVSPSASGVVGWEPHEVAALSTEAFVHPDDLESVRAGFASLTPESPSITSQHRVQHKAGHYIWLESVFRRMDDGSVLVAARDVTARRDAEQALATSEKRFRSLANASSDMIQLLDLTGHRRYVSPAACEIFGCDPGEILGTHPADRIHPDEAPQVRRLIDDLTAGLTERDRSVHRIHHKLGHWVWVEVQFRLVRDSDSGAPQEIVSNIRDVGEREAMRQQLEETNRLLRLAEEIAQVGHWRLELPSGQLTWSEETYRIQGLDSAHYRPCVETAIALYHEDDRAHVGQCVSMALTAHQNYEVRARIVRPDGEVRTVLARGLCEMGPSGSITAVFGTIMDVTELSRAELAAVENEARYRLLADNTTDMITHMDLTGRRLFVSPGSRDLLGYDPEELISTSPLDMIHPDDAAQLQGVLASLKAGHLARAINVNRLRHKDGRWIWVEASLKTLRDKSGHATGFIASLRNIVDRKLADEALRVSEARYRVLAETTSDLITQLDLSMHRQYVSPACRHLLGYEPEEMLGQRPSESVHPDDAADLRALASRLVAGDIEGGRVVTTYRTRHKAGHWLWVEAGLNLVRDDVTGEPVSIICSLRDVTARQRVARHLERAKAAAEEASRTKAEFVANMSHELRTPLTGILGVHDLLRQDASLSDKQRRLVSLASDAGLSLLAIVNDVLDFTKIEAGHLTLERVPFDLDELIAACRDLAIEDLRGKPIEIRAVLHPAVPRRLMGDPTRVRQVILNLLTNAVKFTERGKIVVTVGYAHETGRIRIDVTDTGIGIPPDRAAHLFDRFTQADSSMTRRFGGTGLGLAICKRLTDLMNGRIGAEAVPEGGSRFWFEVPLDPHEQLGSDRVLAGAHRSMGGSHRLLLAEDHAINAEIITAMLVSRGHEVTIASNGVEAVDAFRNGPRFDLVLMDVQMPRMDGIKATAEIRRLELIARANRVPIVGLTANAMAEDAAACMAAGMDAHVAKPVVWADLFATVEQLLKVPGPVATT